MFNFEHSQPQPFASILALCGVQAMTDAKKAARIGKHAPKVREIARGIFDRSERRVVLKFISDAAKLAEHVPPMA